MGLLIVDQDGDLVKPAADDYVDYMPDETRKHVPNLPEMLQILFDAGLESPEDIFVQPKWIAGGIFSAADDFYKFAGARDLFKNEGLLLRHLLRLVILAGEFHTHSNEDPDYTRIADRATAICAQVDAAYTDHFLTQQQQVAELSKL